MTSPTSDRRQGLVGNIPIKAPVTVVATTNVVQSGEQTIDGFAVRAINSAGAPDRVLCIGQTDATQNGIWDVSTASWTRSPDADGNYDLSAGSQVVVTKGSRSFWMYILTTTGVINIGSTALSWVENLSNSSLATLISNAGASLVGFLTTIIYPPGTVGASLSRWKTLQDFDAVCDGVANDTAAVQAAIASGYAIRVFGRAAIDGDIDLLSGSQFFGTDPERDGFVLRPQSAGITGIHGWFRTPPGANASGITMARLGFWSNYSSDTYAGSTAFSVISVSPNSGFTHSYLRFIELKFIDPVYNCIDLTPHSGGLVQNVWADKVSGDVTVTLDKSSRGANLVRTLLEYIDWPGHSTSYGTITAITNLFVSNVFARGLRTAVDLKRGLRRATVENVQTVDMSDCHVSVDGSFAINIKNIVGKHTSNLLPCKNCLEMQGEDIDVENVKYDSDTSFGAIAGVMLTAYAFPIEGVGAAHQSKRIRINKTSIFGVAQNAVRLQDVDTVEIQQLTVQQVTLSAVSIENPGLGGLVPANVTIDGVKNPGGIGAPVVNISAAALNTRIGRIDGRNSRTTSANYRPLYRSGTEYVGDRSMTLVAGALPGFTLASASISQVTTGMVEFAQGIELSDASGAAVGCMPQQGATACQPNETISVRVWAKLNTATKCSVRFQELDISGSVLSTSYMALTANGSTYTENVKHYSTSDPACAYVLTALVAATDNGTVGDTGASRFAGLQIAEGTV